ncbi:SelB C-terminal domain-containing protein [Mumia sp. zg.B53]|uniref:SelB domain-containing protein n=1 Tax=unclassified Mumia TaxID=2621872 RepID=UPI001C6DE97E|nr:MULTISPECIES: SelB C-terminal domain-containing protein [unclassified Mumia]MBW9215935.1 SelB C-terminal domain-containing protein [Mumia sp. zg.B53]MDD9350048.1 SelB C-terminal domain-containing protein [Mumia sp.]
MHVVATAGHVDHGKSTLVDALTGMRSDRLREERERGLSIELGYVWTSLPQVGDVAFVDVPGHERFVTTMLAGIGPVPAAMLVVAADDPWMPQAAEHLAALDALQVSHGVVAVTRADLADPRPMMERAAAEVARTALRGAPVLAVSAPTGDGLAELRVALGDMLAAVPAPDPGADVRLWVDRRFTVRGAGTVVTGTLPEGRLAPGDELEVHAASGVGAVRVRGLQALGGSVDQVMGTARVALNLTGDGVGSIDRGTALVTPGAWRPTTVVDCRVRGEPGRLPDLPLLHVGATAVTARTRSLAGEGGDLVRLSLRAPLPLRVGDRALLRDPGSRRIWGVDVLDPVPPPLRRRGAAAARAKVLAPLTATPDLAAELDRRGLVEADLLHRIGVPTSPPPLGTVEAAGWFMSRTRAEEAAVRVTDAVATQAASRPLDPGVTPRALADRLGLPAPELVLAVVRPPLAVKDGRVVPGDAAATLPPDVERSVRALEADLADAPFAAPTAGRLAELGLDDRRTAAAAKAGRLLRLAPGVVLLPGADTLAARQLADLPQPFTTSEARQRLGTSRRVVLPLLDHLDRARLTRRLPDDRRELLSAPR